MFCAYSPGIVKLHYVIYLQINVFTKLYKFYKGVFRPSSNQSEAI